MKGTIQEIEIKSILKNVIFMDIETTGLDSSLNDGVKHKGEIIEIGAVKVLDDKVYTYRTLIRPEGFVPKFTFQLCKGLTMDMLLEAPTLEEVKDEFLEFIGDMPLVCHNAEFEKTFLKYYIKPDIDISNKFLDSMELVAILFPYFKEYNLDYLIKSVTTIDRDEMHRGLEDSIDTIYVVNSILIKYFNSTLDYLSISSWFDDIDKWQWCDYLLPPENINEYMEKVKINEETIVEKGKKKSIDYKKYEELLKKGEIFDTPSFKYIFREGQYNLAKHVRKTLENKKISIIEAPTGIGKSIGYLLPSIIYSYINNQRIFISSSTKELQDQLIEKDIPRLISTLGLEEKIRYTCMKGRSNYLCNKKVKAYLEEIIDPDLDDILSILFISRLMTVNGNVEEINFWARKHFKKLEYHLNFLTSDGETCTGRKCNEGTNCYYYNKINELENSNIVVVNHSLFLKWPYPEIKIENIVLDEAHNLNDNCFKAFTEEVSNFDIISILREVYNTNKNYGFLKDFIVKNNLSLANVEYVKSKIINVYGTIDELMTLISNRYSSVDNFWGINSVFTYNEFQFIVSVLENLILQLEEIYIRIDEVIKETDAKEHPLISLNNKLRTFKETIDFVIGETTESYCAIIDISKDLSKITLRKVPLSVNYLFKEEILDKCTSLVMTSATIRIDSTLDNFKNSLGISMIDRDRLLEDLIEKPVFDYKNRSVIAIPTNIERYSYNREDEFVKSVSNVILKIARNIGGNILVLFTSTSRMKKVKESIIEELNDLEYDIFDNKKQCNKLRDPLTKAVVFGSRGLFEGVDIPGDGLFTVVMEKIPNIPMKDPLYSSIMDKKKINYNTLNYPQSIIKMKQIFGRLLRSVYDYGYLFVLSNLEDGNSYRTKEYERDLEGPVFLRDTLDNILYKMKKDNERWRRDNLIKIVSKECREEMKKIIKSKKDVDKRLKDFYRDEFNKRNVRCTLEGIVYEGDDVKKLVFNYLGKKFTTSNLE